MSYKDIFLAELVFSLAEHVSEDVIPQPTIQVQSLPSECHISQQVTGDCSAVTAIFGEHDALAAFASQYAKFEVTDDILGEILADFLNMKNGSFVVSLSDTFEAECSLSVPEFSDGAIVPLLKDTYITPVEFDYGTVNFVFSEM